MKIYFFIFITTIIINNNNLKQDYIKIISVLKFEEYLFMNGVDNNFDTVFIYGNSDLIEYIEIGDSISTIDSIDKYYLVQKNTAPLNLPARVNEMTFGYGRPNHLNYGVILNKKYKIYELILP